MGLIASIESFFSRLFSHDPEEARRRTELKKIHALLLGSKPPYYRVKQNLVLPAFAQAVYAFASSLKPLAELARATVANADVRVSQRYFDYLIDCRLPAGARARKEKLGYDAMSERVTASLDSDREIEILSQEFQSLLREIEGLGPRVVNDELVEVDRFIELCRHDYERLLGLFDPGVALDNPEHRPEFAAADGEQILPELIDFYYVTEGFSFSPSLRQNLAHLLERRSAAGLDEGKRRKIEKICAQLERILGERLDSGLLLALIQAAKGDPHYAPELERDKRDFVDSYRRRLTQQFERDRDRIQRERHENAITADIRVLFGETDILEVEGYDEEADAFLRQESPTSFAWIKPLRILKTFISTIFEPSLKDAVKRILVEGYFENKNYQNNLANILYQCERSSARITEFEEQMVGNGRISIVAMRRYVEEMRRGKDIAPFLNRLVDAINGKAKEIVEDEAGLFAMFGDVLSEVLIDYRRASPELVTNIRTFAGGRNKEIMGQILSGRDRILLLMKVMRNFTFIKTVTPDSSPMRPAEGVEDVIMEPSRSAIPAAEAEAVEPGAAPTAADPSVEEAALGDDGSELEDLDGP
jgi:hypothetical protein